MNCGVDGREMWVATVAVNGTARGLMCGRSTPPFGLSQKRYSRFILRSGGQDMACLRRMGLTVGGV